MRGIGSDDDYGEMPQNGTFHRRVEGLACDAGGRKALSTTFDMNRRVFVKTNEEGPILVALSGHLSKGALYVGLGATPAPSECPATVGRLRLVTACKRAYREPHAMEPATTFMEPVTACNGACNRMQWGL